MADKTKTKQRGSSGRREPIPVAPMRISKPRMGLLTITAEDRRHMISIAAYHKAQQRGFAPGWEMQDWLEAEREIDQALPLRPK